MREAFRLKAQSLRALTFLGDGTLAPVLSMRGGAKRSASRRNRCALILCGQSQRAALRLNARRRAALFYEKRGKFALRAARAAGEAFLQVPPRAGSKITYNLKTYT